MVSISSTNKKHIPYTTIICETIEASSKARGTGIAKRDPAYIEEKLINEQAVIALDGDKFAGFCYIEFFGDKKFVVNSGLIVHPDYRGQGLGTKIKKFIFNFSREKYPDIKIFGITTSLPVLKINSSLGYKPVTFSELPKDKYFWNGCKTCVNYEILESKNFQMCLCTGMLYDPSK